jgi:hypothetical protein
VNVSIAGNQFRFEFDSQDGFNHVVQFKTSVADTWQTLATIPGDGTRKQVSDTFGDSQRIYRVTSE